MTARGAIINYLEDSKRKKIKTTTTKTRKNNTKNKTKSYQAKRTQKKKSVFT